MKRESRLLFTKAVDSPVLGIEHFNHPWGRGRVDAALNLLDHFSETLLKTPILHRGGAIRKPRAKQTIGFDECLGKGLSNGGARLLTKEHVLQLQTFLVQPWNARANERAFSELWPPIVAWAVSMLNRGEFA